MVVSLYYAEVRPKRISADVTERSPARERVGLAACFATGLVIGLPIRQAMQMVRLGVAVLAEKEMASSVRRRSDNATDHHP